MKCNPQVLIDQPRPTNQLITTYTKTQLSLLALSAHVLVHKFWFY